MLCGLVGELLLSMHKTLGSVPWTTTIETCLNGSDVQPGLEVTLWVVIPGLGLDNLPNSPSEIEVGFVRLLLFEKRKNSLERNAWSYFS